VRTRPSLTGEIAFHDALPAPTDAGMRALDPAAPPPVHRVGALDGLRAAAILLVIFCHTAGHLHWPTDGAGALLWHVATSCWIGVDVFFVLSGFLITGILIDAKGDAGRPPTGYYRAFYVRRALRIFPPYYVFLALVFLVLRTPTPHGAWWYWSYLTNIMRATAPRRVLFPEPHLWSLAVEEQFYLLWPATIALIPRHRMRPACWCVLVASTACRVVVTQHLGWSVAYLLTSCRLDEFAAGALLALHTRDGRRWALDRRTLFLIATLAALWLGARILSDMVAVPYTWPRLEIATALVTVLSVTSIALVVPPISDPVLSRILSHSALRSIGRYSYTMYLVHLDVGVTLDVWTLRTLSATRPYLAIVLHVVGTLAVSWAIAWVSWRLLERPLLSLKQRQPMPLPRTLRPAGVH